MELGSRTLHLRINCSSLPAFKPGDTSMREWPSRLQTACLALLLFVLLPGAALAGSNDPCPRPAEGSVIAQPPDLYSDKGVLNVTLNYYTALDKLGRTLFCYTTPDGLEAPTLHVNPGDTLNITLTNDEMGPKTSNAGLKGAKATLSLQAMGVPSETISSTANACGATTMSVLSANLHFHGLNVSPTCHSDEVIRTLVNPGESFNYTLKIPRDEPPGMYWYHAHVHGIASHAVQGGASGAIEVEGIADLQPAVQGLPQRFLVVRDQPLANPVTLGNPTTQQVPFWDISLNYVPISYPRYVPGIIKMQAGAREFWRVVNATADTVIDLELLYDYKAQPLQIAALDGVPTGSQDGTKQGKIITKYDILIPPAGRAEFIVTGPSTKIKNMLFRTRYIDTGPAGDVDTLRPLARIELTNNLHSIPKAILATGAPVHAQRFAGVTDAMVTAKRFLHFDEKIGVSKKNPTGGMIFFITVDGGFDRIYDPNEPPAVVTYKGAVEDWTISNHTKEVHEFHMHQVHFQLLEINGKPVPPRQRQWYDTLQVPYWSGEGDFPSIKVRMDFRGAVEGEFVYHCHILDHEDLGMMANILVTTAPPKAARNGPYPRQANRPGEHRTRTAALPPA
jgi:FtsP/CotA-like multicopper oxidase with cupredoxin domain